MKTTKINFTIGLVDYELSRVKNDLTKQERIILRSPQIKTLLAAWDIKYLRDGRIEDVDIARSIVVNSSASKSENAVEQIVKMLDLLIPAPKSK